VIRDLDKSPHVGIVTLNWNQLHDTTVCLSSLGRLEYPSFEVVLVDNGSVDGSPGLIRQRFPGITVIENGRNLGFAAGNNVGIAELIRRGADYVLLLNNDTEVAPNFLRVLVEAAESIPAAGILGPTVFYFDPPDVIWSAGGSIDRYGRPRHLEVDRRDAGTLEPVREVDYVTGCAMLVKKDVIDRVGVLNERFFMYFEESEWCARARKAGFRVVHVSGARIWHKIAPSARAQSCRYLYLMARNRLLYLQCCHASPWIVAIAALDLLRTAASWRLRRRHKDKRALSGALVRGVRDYALGHLGAPPARL